MKRLNTVKKVSSQKNGVVLLLILGLMAMFSMIVLTFMIVTSNLAETAKNVAESETTVKPEPRDDCYDALRTLVAGTGNRMSPIAPFGLLENLYGNYNKWWRTGTAADGSGYWSDNSFSARIEKITEPDPNDPSKNRLTHIRIYRYASTGSTTRNPDYSSWDLFEQTGTVVTFGIANSGQTYTESWDGTVANTSSHVRKKAVTRPEQPGPITSEDYDNWYLEVTATDALRKFFNDNNTLNQVDATVRLNLPAFSGTGAGWFNPDRTLSPMNVPIEMGGLDGSPIITAGGVSAWSDNAIKFRVPFAKWANASAPDMVPFVENKNTFPSAQAFWAHLLDGLYDPFQIYSDASDNLFIRYMDLTGSGSNKVWSPVKPVVEGFEPDANLQPVRMNPTYTAPDQRNLFLAWYDRTPDPNNPDSWLDIIPSFHRPNLMAWALRQTCDHDNNPSTNNVSIFGSGLGKSNPFTADDERNSGVEALSIIRKLTPRPLQLDHWNFTGSNPDLDLDRFLEPVVSLGILRNWRDQLRNNSNTEKPMNYYAKTLAHMLDKNVRSDGTNSRAGQWDVDNDNDSIREGIWIPSGLPIRTDDKGRPFATMYSYTILDMDGRININTAGTWDQLPQYYQGITNPIDPYNKLDDLNNLRNVITAAGINAVPSPFEDMESLVAFGDWRDDKGTSRAIPTADLSYMTHRGTGLGPASVNLAKGLENIGFTNPSLWTTLQAQMAISASNLLWRRYTEQPRQLNQLNANASNPVALDATNLYRSHYSQPGVAYLQNSVINNIDWQFPGSSEIRQFAFQNPVYFGNAPTATNPNSAEFVFPYRGTTRITNFTTRPDRFSPRNFADSALRTYDPLGHQVYSTPPMLSENPYLMPVYSQSLGDTPYSIPAFERLLRYFDTDAQLLPQTLIDDLTNNSSKETIASNVIIQNAIKEARQSLTPISSDIPAASMLFVDSQKDGEYGKGFEGGGAYGIQALIRKCVTAELAKNEYSVSEIERQLATNAPAQTAAIDLLNNKIDEITMYLVSLLPEETLLGKKIDLNKLSQKSYWLDVRFTNNKFSQSTMDDEYSAFMATSTSKNKIHAYGLTKRMEYARGMYILMMALCYEDRNAQDIYPNITNNTDPDYNQIEVTPGTFVNKYPDYSNYFEGGFDVKINPSDSATEIDEKKEKSANLIAHRIAQWCANVIDFSDPDATMTPFFYDPNPFDGWWTTNKSNAIVTNAIAAATGGGGGTPGSFDINAMQNYLNSLLIPTFAFTRNTATVNKTPQENMLSFFYDLLCYDPVSSPRPTGPDQLYDPQIFAGLNNTGKDPLAAVTDVTLKTNAQLVRYFLCNLKINATNDGFEVDTDDQDRGFRLVWGMERPDLVLTETMSMHDLGIADSNVTDGNKVNTTETVAGGAPDEHRVTGTNDTHFDQVRRPQGSTYLELVCTANPNVHQSPELYRYAVVTDMNGNPITNGSTNVFQWQLDLSRQTPSLVDKAGDTLTFPVWRIAISEGRVPSSKPVKNTPYFRKKENNAIFQIKENFSTFSMQPKQFRNLPIPKDTVLDKLDDIECFPAAPGTTLARTDWKDFNLQVSNLTKVKDGITQYITNQSDAQKNQETEIELDRLVWFCKAEADSAPGSGKLGTFSKYPDAVRIFSNKSDTSANPLLLAPNQYLVIGPDQARSLGSRTKASVASGSSNASNQKKYGGQGEYLGNGTQTGTLYDPGQYGSYGIPSQNQINLKKLDQMVNGTTDNITRNYKYMVAIANIGGIGLSISEPLWLATDNPAAGTQDSQDPYLKRRGLTDLYDQVALPREFKLRDIPFELPSSWGGGSNDTTDFPIAEDGLFGLGVVPAYKSAFVQRVADPNRPYHPLLNPYITVDWNTMDLTVFNGEAHDMSASGETTENETTFCNDPAQYDFGTDKNKIKLAAEPTLGITAGDAYSYATQAFSSRQWGKAGHGSITSQKAFSPEIQNTLLPNFWARAFNFTGVGNGGLDTQLTYTPIAFNGDTDNDAIMVKPDHTLGYFNNRGEQGFLTGNETSGWTFTPKTDLKDCNWYSNLNPTFRNSPWSSYYGAPGAPDPTNGNKGKALPFEHLVWNDAPFENPGQLTLVPASSPGRFGLEFIRNAKNFATLPALANMPEQNLYDFQALYKAIPGSGTSLGTAGILDKSVATALGGPFGFDFKENSTNDASAFGDQTKKLGPYLNFFASSLNTGNTLNLGKLLDFVRVPSPVLGTRTDGGFEYFFDDSSDLLAGAKMDDTMREPGKINLNTAKQNAWAALTGETTSSIFASYTDNNATPPLLGFDSSRKYCPFQPQASVSLHQLINDLFDNQDVVNQPTQPRTSYYTLLRRPFREDTKDPIATPAADLDGTDPVVAVAGDTDPLFDASKATEKRGNMYAALEEIQRLSGLTTNRSNVFAVWLTVGYFEVERANPGENIPLYDPSGNQLTQAKLADPSYQYYYYYKAIYPDGFTYGKELGLDTGENKRHRSFSLIDRSIPVDFRRGNSLNWQNSVLMHRVVE